MAIPRPHVVACTRELRAFGRPVCDEGVGVGTVCDDSTNVPWGVSCSSMFGVSHDGTVSANVSCYAVHTARGVGNM